MHFKKKLPESLQFIFVAALLISLFQYGLQQRKIIEDWEFKFQSVYYDISEHFIKPSAPSKQIILVEIDDSSLKDGDSRSPLSRLQIARWITELSSHQPRLIAVNILFDRMISKKGDQHLIDALSGAGNVILRTDAQTPVRSEFERAAQGTGAVKVWIDSSGVAQQICASISTCSVKSFLKQILFHSGYGTLGQTIGNDPWQRVHYKSLAVPFLKFKVQDIKNLPQKALKDKIILVGTGFTDLYPTYRHPYTNNNGIVQEVELVGELLNNFLQEGVFTEFPPSIYSLFYLIVLLLMGNFLWRFNTLNGAYLIIFSLGLITLFATFLFISLRVDFPLLLPATGILIFWGLCLISKSIRNRLEMLEVQLQLKQAKIDFLTNELHSHHLFNEFSRISVMIRQDPVSARDYLLEFADMLRLSLKYGDQKYVPLSAQIDYLKAYIGQQKVIYKEQLSINFGIHGKLDNVLAGWHLFYPLLENAIKYSEVILQKKERKDAVDIDINLEIQSSNIQFTVRNPFIAGSSVSSTKKGIRNLETRLDALYPENSWKLEFSEKEGIWQSILTISR